MILNQIQLQKENLENEFRFTSILSFAPFLQYLHQHKAQSGCRLDLYNKAIEMIESQFPYGNYKINSDNIAHYEDLYKLVFQFVTNPLIDENKYRWGLASPFSSDIVLGTNAFSHLVGEKKFVDFVHIENFKRECQRTESEVKKIVIYAFLLQKYYQINIFNTINLTFRLSLNGQETYYEIKYNDQFIDVLFDGELPKIDKSITEMESFSKVSTLQWLESQLPLEKVKFEGFSIIEINDITDKVLKNNLKDLILTTSLIQDNLENMTGIIRQLSGCDQLDLLLLPILYQNDHLISEVWQITSKMIKTTLTKYLIDYNDFLPFISLYTKNPRYIYRENIQSNKDKNEDLKEWIVSGLLGSLIVKPIYSKTGLVGIVLIFSHCANFDSENFARSLGEMDPFLQNFFEGSIRGFLNEIGKVVKNKFTAIQSSVEWKFNEAALQFLKDKEIDKHPMMSPIRFENIYPIYGAIDFRNSTIARNKAEMEDLIVQLNVLDETIGKIEDYISFEILGEVKFQARRWIDILKDGFVANKEYAINHFLQIESLEMLHQLAERNSHIARIVAAYEKEMSPDGQFSANSLALEKTFRILNSNISSILDQMNDKLQAVYPCYFERYRTDGVEFNIYIGQSITPDIPFNKLYLKNVQLWQLNTMALVAKITEKSQSLLPRKIQTTQLIFIHSNTITTTFRNDERRFDVENGYNVRYEIIKKRIDKATIKGSGERLTQPGKIAIVYFQRKDVEDYLIHIQYLQNIGVLINCIEELEINDLQGVSGLKALRISVSDHPELAPIYPSLLLENPVDVVAQNKANSTSA